MTTALIDADIGIYRVGFASQDVELGFAIARMDTWIGDILRATNAKNYRVYLTSDDKSNFRYSIYPEYKANRKSPRPKYYDDLRAHLIRFYPTTVVEGMEADDAIGQAQTDDTIICSIDKDLNQIPGMHYDFVKDVMYEISQETAERFFWFQMLMGDATDNIKGVPKVGPKTADRLLDDTRSYAQSVYEAYEAYYGESKALEMMTLNGRLLWIKKKEGEELWEPPKVEIEADLSTEVASNELRGEPYSDPNFSSTTSR